MAGENEPPSNTAPAPPSVAGSTKEKVHVKHLILDAGAIIKGTGYTLASMADNFWTIPEVIAEIRDPRAR